MAEPNTQQSIPGSPSDTEETAGLSVTLSHHGKQHTFEFPSDATITDLSLDVEGQLLIPVQNQKYLVPKLGMLKYPFADPELNLAPLQNKKITLMGTSNAEIASMNQASQAATARAEHLARARRNQPKLYSRRDPIRQQEDSQYTFLQVRALPNLPNPSRSQAFLERLRDDPGIRTVMRSRKFTVGLLTEMEPLSNTEAGPDGGVSRLLGLNRNRGQVIELRLRTDAYDGYRDYKTIRNTLCHELTHNVHSDHDRKFWDLCHQIEREVARADWTRGGRSVAGGGGGADFYEPPPGTGEEEDIAYDHGGWTGGVNVLGGGGNVGNTSTGGGGGNAISRREAMARAAEARRKKPDETSPKEDRSSAS